MSNPPTPIAIIGAGPAGMMAAEVLTDAGHAVDIYDAMPSVGRKFLMAGKSGLNITHAEGLDLFLSRYAGQDQRLRDMVQGFTPHNIIRWMKDLGIEAHTGSTGRIFPTMMKASPLLRAWLARLQEKGVVIHTRHRWTGWDERGALKFEGPDGPLTVAPTAAVFALGGASWKRLGSDGAWADHFRKRQIPLRAFEPSNGGFLVDWTEHMKREFAGAAVKAVRLTAEGGEGPVSTRSE
ncbi:MAG: TIGR03862 family flavoprotein, partial [Pseudomonadota bacterium]